MTILSLSAVADAAAAAAFAAAASVRWTVDADGRRRSSPSSSRRIRQVVNGRRAAASSLSSLLVAPPSWCLLVLLLVMGPGPFDLGGWCAQAVGSRRIRTNNNANSRSIGVMNDSGVKIDVFWVNPDTKQLAESSVGSGIMFGGSSGINSYVGHTFEVQEMPSKKGCVGPNKECRKTYFTVSGDEDQVFIVEKNFTVTIENHRTKALKIAHEAIHSCEAPDAALPALEQLDAYANCLAQQLNQTLEAKQEEIEFEKSIRKKMADQMALYACDDPKLETTKATRNTTWTYRDETTASTSEGNTAKRIRDVPHRVQVLFESDASTVLLVKDFYSSAECQQLIDVSVPASTTTAEANPATSLQHRNVPLSAKAKVGPLLAKMYQLVLGYVQTGVEYTHDPMLVLQFHTGGEGGETPTKECVVSESGEATGECAPSSSSSSIPPTQGAKLHKADDKALAQLRVVCAKSDELVGGAVHYPKAGVHINPAQQELAAGYAVLTVYHDPKTGAREQDPFVEEHVECPVQQGELVSIVQYFVGPA